VVPRVVLIITADSSVAVLGVSRFNLKIVSNITHTLNDKAVTHKII
jgi:hypothetical protein